MRLFSLLLLLVSFTNQAAIITISGEGQGRYFAEDNRDYELISYSLEIVLDTSDMSNETYELKNADGKVVAAHTNYSNVFKQISLTSTYFDKTFDLDESILGFGFDQDSPYTVLTLMGASYSDPNSILHFEFIMFEREVIHETLRNINNAAFYQYDWEFINPSYSTQQPDLNEPEPLGNMSSFWTYQDKANSPVFYLMSIDNDSVDVTKVSEPGMIYAIVFLFLIYLGVGRKFRQAKMSGY